MNKLMLNTIALDGNNVVVKKKGGAAAGGMPIVATEEELQALNLPVGSIASVAQAGVEETSFRNLYQPTMDDLDQNTMSLVNPDALSVVSQLKFSFPQEEINAYYIPSISFFPKDLSMNNIQQINLYINSGHNGDKISNVAWDYIFMKDGSPAITGHNIAKLTGGSWEIHQEEIDALNDMLGNGEWVYFGSDGAPITEEKFDLLDKFCVAISSVTKTDAYIKADTWQELAKQDSISDLDAIREGAALGATAVQKMKFVSLDNYGGGSVYVESKENEYYYITDSTYDLSVALPDAYSEVTGEKFFINVYLSSPPSIRFIRGGGYGGYVYAESGMTIQPYKRHEFCVRRISNTDWIVSATIINTNAIDTITPSGNPQAISADEDILDTTE